MSNEQQQPSGGTAERGATGHIADRVPEPASDLYELSSILRRLADSLVSQPFADRLRVAVLKRDEALVAQILREAAIPGDPGVDETGPLVLAVRLGPIDALLTVRID